MNYLDTEGSPRTFFNEMIVVGCLSAMPFGIWWLGCRLFTWLGWQSFGSVFHIVGFALALFVSLGIVWGAKNSAAAASFGAFFLDVSVVALFLLVFRGEFWTLWTLTALIGLAIHLVGRTPAAARFQAEQDCKAEEDGLENTAQSLIEQGADPAVVQKAVEEIRAKGKTGDQVAWFKLVKALEPHMAEVNRRKEAEKAAREKALAAKREAARKAAAKREAEEAAREKALAAKREAARKAAAKREAAEEARRHREAEENEVREETTVSSWAARLAKHPEEAEFFDGWSDFSPEDWILLLPKQPQFAKKCRWAELPESAADRIVALCPRLGKYKVWDETYEDEEGNEITVRHDNAAVERGIEAFGSASFWEAIAAQNQSSSDEDGDDF